MKKVLICGASGFMGTNITLDMLNKGYEVHVVIHKNTRSVLERNDIRTHITDLTDRSQVDTLFSEGFDIVVQAAAVTTGIEDTVHRPNIHVTDNIIMNTLILAACYKYKIKHFIFLSCAVMYQSSNIPQTEEDFSLNDPIHPMYFGVGWMKIYVEKQCEFFSKFGITKHTVVKHTNTYGPFDKFDLQKGHVLAASIKKVIEAQTSSIEAWGNGTEARDLIYVQDVCDFIQCVIDKQEKFFELFHVSSGYAITVKELIEKIIKHANKNISIKWDTDKPTINFTVTLDSSKAKNLLNWNPKINIDEGLQNTIKFFKENFN